MSQLGTGSVMAVRRRFYKGGVTLRWLTVTDASGTLLELAAALTQASHQLELGRSSAVRRKSVAE